MNAGKVIKKQSGGPYGNRLTIQHDDGTEIMYAHLDCFLVEVGVDIKAGQKIAVMGDTGSDNKHLHISFWEKGIARNSFRNTSNPADYIKQHHWPTNTKASNPYGSEYHHRSLDAHEGLDFSGRRSNLIGGWQYGLSHGFWATSDYYSLIPR